MNELGTPSSLRVGFIGLGIMGRGMVANLLTRGFSVAVYNRTRSVCERLFPELPCRDSPAELARDADVVLVCVADPPAVDSVYLGPDGLLGTIESGAVVVECSTIGPAQAERLARATEERGARYLAAPVTGSKPGAESGSLLFIVGGASEVLERVRPVLLAMGQEICLVGDVRQAFVAKLIGNSFVSLMTLALTEGVLLAERAGVSTAALLEVVQKSGYASRFYEWKGKAAMHADFSTNFALDLLIKDQRLMLTLADDLDVPLAGLRAAHQSFVEASQAGHGERDIVALLLHQREMVHRSR